MMENTQAPAEVATRGNRYPLLFQKRLNEQVFWVCLIIIAICAAMLIWNPEPVTLYRGYFMVIAVATGLILILTLIYRLRAYVQCQEHALRIQLPFHHLDIPYQAITTTRPTQLHHMFPAERQRWTRRNFMAPLWGLTVIVVESDVFTPGDDRFRLWMSPYMICPDAPGLNLLVRDWIGFRTELDEAIARDRRLF